VKEASSIAAMNLGGNFHGSLFDMVVHAGFVVQLVLLLLFHFSISEKSGKRTSHF
jgi:hypothetical protein